MVQAEGSISQGNIRTRVQSDRNEVRLVARGATSDIRVDQIDVSNRGDVFLIADDDVVSNGSGDLIKADFLSANARNQTAGGAGGGAGGIVLTTDAGTAQFIVGNRSDANLSLIHI